MKTPVLASFALALALACSGGDDGDDGDDGGKGGTGGTGGKPMPDPTPTYKREAIVGCGKGGYQTRIVSRGSKVALVTLATTDRTGKCMVMGRPESDVSLWDVCYAEASGAAAFAAKIVSSEPYVSPMGAAVALDADGNPAVAYPGGNAGMLRCGSSDLMLARGATFSEKRAIAESSASGGLVMDQSTQCVQDVCNTGDVTGFFPALAVDKGGKLAAVWRDLHIGFAADDLESSDVEFGRGDGFQSLTIDVSRGGGSYLRLAFTPDDKAAVAHYNGGKANYAGVWFHLEAGGNAWTAKRVTTAKVGEEIGFAVSGNGRFGVAYYDEGRTRLVYVESQDGTSWGNPVDVDTDGITGLYPSLAFDDAGEPAIAYYRCADYHPTDRNCKPAKDGVYLARRSAGKWKSHVVAADGSRFDGLYPALTFASGKAIVAYQTRFFDPATNESSVELAVARQQ